MARDAVAAPRRAVRLLHASLDTAIHRIPMNEQGRTHETVTLYLRRVAAQASRPREREKEQAKHGERDERADC